MSNKTTGDIYAYVTAIRKVGSAEAVISSEKTREGSKYDHSRVFF